MDKKFICSECGEEMDENCDFCDECAADYDDTEEDEE